MKIRLDLKYKRLFIAVISAVLLSALFQLIYLPKQKQLKALEKEYRQVVSGIESLYGFIGGRENLKDNIIRMRSRLASAERAFPSEKELSNIVKELNRKAEYFKVGVISLKPGDIQIYKDKKGAPLKVYDSFCKRMSLVLDTEGRYNDLGKFIMNLENSMTPVICVNKVEIEKDKNRGPEVKARLSIAAYILGQ